MHVFRRNRHRDAKSNGSNAANASKRTFLSVINQAKTTNRTTNEIVGSDEYKPNDDELSPLDVSPDTSNNRRVPLASFSHMHTFVSAMWMCVCACIL